ncbi:effector-associated constant component EACC1 [Streptomyces tauricus]|uniref:effector-associated constant component EACC1 n=1 Tax=Streptomyces tauricus TaxID=68274 RepID=UPI0037FC08F9
MGGVLDVLQLVTANGWSAASFVLSVAAWRQTRPRTPQVTIRRGTTEISTGIGWKVETCQ